MSALCCGAHNQTLRLIEFRMQGNGVPRQESGPMFRDLAVVSRAHQSRPCTRERACWICQRSSPRFWIGRTVRCTAMGQSHEMTVRWSVRGCVMLAVPYAYPRSSSSSDRHRDGAYAEATKQLKNGVCTPAMTPVTMFCKWVGKTKRPRNRYR